MKIDLRILLIIMFMLGIGVYFVDIGLNSQWISIVSLLLLIVPTIFYRQYYVVKKNIKSALLVIIVIWTISFSIMIVKLLLEGVLN